jgi:hypothetical protein
MENLLSLTRGHQPVMRSFATATKLRVVTLLFLLQMFGGLLSVGAAPFELISGHDPFQAPPSGGGGDSWGPILSPNGRYVLFASTANNLLLTSNNTALPLMGSPKLNVFLRDRTNGSTTLVSVNSNGVGGNGDSIPTGISTNGRYACFESTASDLVTGDTNGVKDISARSGEQHHNIGQREERWRARQRSLSRVDDDAGWSLCRFRQRSDQSGG